MNNVVDDTSFLDFILKDKVVRSKLMTVDPRDRLKIQKELLEAGGREKFLNDLLTYRRI